MTRSPARWPTLGAVGMEAPGTCSLRRQHEPNGSGDRGAPHGCTGVTGRWRVRCGCCIAHLVDRVPAVEEHQEWAGSRGCDGCRGSKEGQVDERAEDNRTTHGEEGHARGVRAGFPRLMERAQPPEHHGPTRSRHADANACCDPRTALCGTAAGQREADNECDGDRSGPHGCTAAAGGRA